MSILDTFYILFRSNADEVKKATGEAKKATDEFQESLNKTDKTTANLATSLLQVGVEAFTAFKAYGAIKSGLQSALDFNLQLEKTANLTGQNSEEIAAWDQAFQRLGADKGEFLSWFVSFSQYLQRTGQDTKNIIPWLHALSNELKSLPEDEARQRFQQVAEAYGLPQSFFLGLQKGGAALDELIAKQEKLIKANQESKKTAREFEAAWEDLGSSLVGIFSDIGTFFEKRLIRPMEILASLFSGQFGKAFELWRTTGMATPVSPQAGIDRNAPLGIRMNNPGNLRPGGREASYATLEEGLTAEQEQLKRYGKRGINTLSGIGSTWAPPNENDTASYIRALSRSTGYDANQQLDMSNPDVIRKIANAINAQENGAAYGNLIGGTSSSEKNVTIGSVTVNTQATDANGIAASLADALNTHFRTTVGNYDDGVAK